jgi:hypothetical protein
VQVQEHDRLVSRDLAEEYSVSTDGTIVLVVGERAERIILPVAFRQARYQLRSFDIGVQTAILGLIRTNRTVFLTVGHGELNAPISSLGASVDGRREGGFSGGEMDQSQEELPEWMRAQDPAGSANVFSEVLGLLNYDVQEIGIQSGLATGIPETAAMVAILGPRTPFHPEEMATLLRYLDAGGSILLALEPRSTFDPGPLTEKLGIRFVPTPLANDVPGQFLVNRSTPSDRQLIITNQFYSHSATTTILEAQDNLGMLFVEAGYLEEAEGVQGVDTRIIVEAISSSFADLDGDFTYDEGAETRFRYALAIGAEQESASAAGGEVVSQDSAADTLGETSEGEAASGVPAPQEGEAETPQVTGTVAGGATETQRWRALVFADSEIFSDGVLFNLVQNRTILADGARWLGRDEDLAGSTESEGDVRIVHTRAEHVAWFYAIIAGAPFLVLSGGLIGVFLRRRSRGEG